MASKLVTSVFAGGCFLALAVSPRAAEEVDIAGVWYGMHVLPITGGEPIRTSDPAVGMGLLPSTTFYRLEVVEIEGDEVVASFVSASAIDRRSPAEQSMEALGLPARPGPAVPSAWKATGTLDGRALTLHEFALLRQASASPVSSPVLVRRPQSFTARLRGDDLRAEIDFGNHVEAVRLVRCMPASESDDSCSPKALWQSYLEKSTEYERRTRFERALSEIARRANRP